MSGAQKMEEVWTEISRLLLAYEEAETEERRAAVAKDYDELRQRLRAERIEDKSTETIHGDRHP